MPRSKVKLAFLEDYKSRKTSFMGRNEILKKKLEELSDSYNVKACAIIYSPSDPQVEVWPNDNTVFQNVLNEFLKKSKIERNKHMVNQVGYLKEKISKVKQQINKQKLQNRDLCQRKLEDVNEKIELQKINASTDWYPSDWIKTLSSSDDTTNDLCSNAYVPSYPPEWIDLLSSPDGADNPLWYALFK